MKNSLLVNYWLVILSWCLFLNDYIVLSLLVMLGSIVYIICILSHINLWRCGFVLSANILWFLFLGRVSSIGSFFPEISLFGFFFAVNNALFTELVNSSRARDIYPSYLILACVAVFVSLIALFVPEYDYSLFTKMNLYLLITYIFSSYLFENTVVLVYKELHIVSLKKRIRSLID